MKLCIKEPLLPSEDKVTDLPSLDYYAHWRMDHLRTTPGYWCISQFIVYFWMNTAIVKDYWDIA